MFSAAFSEGAVGRLLKDLQKASFTLVADRYVIEEAYRNLSIQRPDAVPTLNTLVKSLTLVPSHRTSSRISQGIHLPEKDIPVLATALESGCKVLITGDVRHFGPLFGQTIGALSIYSPVEAARRLLTL